jgi:hypothetical protein
LIVEFDVPSPKLQFHEVGDPVLVSLNATFNGAFPEVGVAEKLATGSTIPEVPGTVKALMHTFVFEKLVVMSVQAFPLELTKLSPAFAFALLLQPAKGISTAIGKL